MKKVEAFCRAVPIFVPTAPWMRRMSPLCGEGNGGGGWTRLMRLGIGAWETRAHNTGRQHERGEACSEPSRTSLLTRSPEGWRS